MLTVTPGSGDPPFVVGTVALRDLPEPTTGVFLLVGCVSLSIASRRRNLCGGVKVKNER